MNSLSNKTILFSYGATMVILRHFVFHKMFLSLQVKRSVIFTNKHGIYQSPQELANDSILSILANQEISKNIKTSQNYSLMPSFSPNSNFFQYQRKTPEKQKLYFPRKALFYIKARILLKYFVHDCIWKQAFASNLPSGPFKLDLIDKFGTYQSFNTVLT